MANYQLLKADIDERVYENARQKITGANLNYVLNQMVTTLGAEYQFAGVATIDTNPGTPDAKVFYIANGKGTYTNFGRLEVTEDEVVVLYWDTAWHKEATGIASQAKLSELESEVSQLGKYYAGVVEPSYLPGSTTNASIILFQQTPKLKHISGISFLAKTGTTNFYKVDTNTTPATITLLQTINNSSDEEGVVKSFNVELELPEGVYLGYNGAIRYAAVSSALDGYIGGNCATDGTDLHLGNRFMAGFMAFCAVKDYVWDEIEDIDKEIKEIQEKESIEVGIVDSSILTSYTTKNDVVFFQKTPICSHIDKIRFLAKTGTTKFYKVNLNTLPATITQIKEIVTISEENNTIKEFDVNIDLLGGEYIGINGTICYKAVSGVPDGFIGASCNIDGTDIQQESVIALGYQLVTSVKDVVVDLNKQVEKLESEHISLETIGTDLSTTLPQGTNNTSNIHVIKTPTALGKGVKINYKARTGTINFYKIHIDTISVGESAIITPIASIVNASGEQGNIKSIEIDVDFGENDYLGVNGSFYYMTQKYGANNPNFTSFSINASTGVIEDATINVFVVGCNIVVKSIKEIRKTPKNIVFVDAQGNGDYLTPFDAIVALLGKDTATNPYTIVVAPGVYVTPTLSFADKYKWCQNRYLSIVGTDKNNCIIRNDKGYYNADDGLGDNAPIKLSGNIYIANLTIISTDNENASQEDVKYHLSYCIHIDSAAPEGSIMEIHNCRLVNNHAPCIGFGLPKNVVLKITDCELEADMYDTSETYAGAVIWGHDREGASSVQVQEHLFVKNCIIKSSNGYAVRVLNNRGFLADCVFVGNACAVPFGKGISLGAGTTVVAPSFGNNIAEMNFEPSL